MKKKIISILVVLCIVVGLVSGISTDAKSKRIKLNMMNVTLHVGSTFKLRVKTKPVSFKKKVKFSSSKKSVAKVSKKGKITAVAAGKAKVIAKVKKTKYKAVCKVKVTNTEEVRQDLPVTSVMPTSTAKNTNDTNIVTPTNQPDNQSDNHPEETAKPTPQVIENPATSIKLDIDKKGKNVEEIEANKLYCITVELGESIDLNSDIEPADVSKEDIVYESSIDKVATIEDGKVKALYPGMTEITVYSKTNSDVSAKVYIKVNDTTEPDPSFKRYNNSIPHGQINIITYNTDYRNTSTVQARVWTPADYSTDKKYNVLYCLHGGGGDMWYWTNDKGGTNDGCSADKILDNMYAEGLFKDTIVVFPNGSIDYNSNKTYKNIPSDRKAYDGMFSVAYLFEFELINNLIPYIDSHYPVAEGPEHRGVCGLSMGGGQTYNAAFRHPEMFSYVSVFSCNPFEGDNQTILTSKKRAQELNECFKLLILQVGSNDGLGAGEKVFEQTCTKYGLNHSWVVEPNLGHEDAEWDLNLYKFMKYAFK